MSATQAAPAPITPSSLEELRPHVGRELGVSGWRLVTQADVDNFARVTGDDYWIHTDPERARRSPFGGTVAHGYLTLSLAAAMTYEVLSYERFETAVNYGVNRARFPAALPVGARVRMRALLRALEPQPRGGLITLGLTFESDANEKPVCAAETLTRVFEAAEAGGSAA